MLTMLFLFPAMNFVFMTVLIIVYRNWASSENNTLNRHRLTLIAATSTVLLLVLPWTQMMLGTEFIGYGFVARLAERVLQAIFWTL